MSKRKGKIQFSDQSMLSVPAVTDEEEVDQAFKRDQKLLRKLLQSCKGEELDSKLSLRALREMLTETNIARSKFEMVFNIL